ncbi:MAG TPA: hypothetical protein VMT31_02775 [Methanomicrobiales archaeon]|jgi:hypothetical protein|nr:hypothetical protein [Methanomicrobiales archaeon]
MERYRFLALSLPLLAAGAAAQETFSLESESAWLMAFATSYFLPVVGGILLIFLLSAMVNRATRRRYRAVEFVVTFSGVVLAIILILTGLVFWAAASVLAWGTATKDMSYGGAESWAVPLSNEIQSIIQPALDIAFGNIDYTPYLQNILLGVLLIGGGIIIVLGILLIWKLPKSSFYEIIAPGKITTFREVMTRGHEPLAPTVTFKVIDRLTNQPSADVKVLLKHKEGAKVYTRYTDFNGEVIFQKIDGLYSQYYAFVEGDEERKRYWVIRTAIGAESVT